MKKARILVLIVALAAGGLAAMLASRSGPTPPPQPQQTQIETTEILIAKNDIAMGQAVTDKDIQWQMWPASAASPRFIRRSDQPDAMQKISGSIARTPFVVGEPIREDKIIKGNGSGFMAAILPSGMRAISVEISPETGAGGFILPNDHVDVILTRRDKEAEKATGIEVHTSETILGNVRVLAIDQAIEEKNGQRVVVGKTATLELSPRQSESLALSRQLGTLTLALRSIADTDKTAKTAPEEDETSRGINMVRFGVTTVTTPK
jgi:pilus assembly protein CpaB